MNREIKFRAWDAYREIMMEPFITYTIENGCVSVNENYHEDKDPYEWDRGYQASNLQQYIGLKDKAGKEVYEGDKIKYTNKKSGISGFGTICFSSDLARFSLEDSKDEIRYQINPYEIEIEVIGNVFENPEKP